MACVRFLWAQLRLLSAAGDNGTHSMWFNLWFAVDGFFPGSDSLLYPLPDDRIENFFKKLIRQYRCAFCTILWYWRGCDECFINESTENKTQNKMKQKFRMKIIIDLLMSVLNAFHVCLLFALQLFWLLCDFQSTIDGDGRALLLKRFI